MAKIFITGSTDGLGRAAAQALIQESHHVVLHARSPERAAALDDLASRSADVVIGDLSSATDTRNVANQVNALGWNSTRSASSFFCPKRTLWSTTLANIRATIGS